MNDEREAVKEMLLAEKRTMKLLDARINDLEQLIREEELPEWQAAAKRHPFFYSAIGVDGEPGIPLVDNLDFGAVDDQVSQFEREKIFEGLVTIQNDAPFVWTHIMTVQTVLDSFYASIQESSPLLTSGAALQQLGFIDNGSGRVLFQADRENDVGELLAAPFFDTYRNYDADEPDDNFPGGGLNVAYRPGVYAQGHGPNAPFELPAETVLPMNGSVTVQAKPLIYNVTDNDIEEQRLYVTLLGYKVFGD
jgi:hypothetical protein